MRHRRASFGRRRSAVRPVSGGVLFGAQCAALWALAACDPTTFGPRPSPTDSTASPTANVTPEPLDDPRDAGVAPVPRNDASRDASEAAPKPPERLQADTPLPRDRFSDRDQIGITMKVALRRAALPGPPSLPEVATDVVQALRTEQASELEVSLAGKGRMRVSVGKGFYLTPDTALVARRDRYGHTLLWPSGNRYRVVAPGALRTLFGEGRLDVTQLSPGRTKKLPPGERLGLEVERHQLRTPIGEIDLELAEIAEAGASAGLWCRFVVELIGASPAHPVCDRGRVLLSADLRWTPAKGTPKGTASAGLRLDALSFERREDIAGADFAMPPRSARFVDAAPTLAPDVLLTSQQLRSLRNADAAPPEAGPTLTPAVEAENASDRPLMLFLDGLTVGFVAPWKTLRVEGLRPGRYTVHWRSFLGDAMVATSERWLPTRISTNPEPPASDPPLPTP